MLTTCSFQMSDSDPPGRQYLLGRRLGRGGFSEVRLGKLRGCTDGQRFAIKVVDLRKPKASRIERQPYWEIELLKRLRQTQRVIHMFAR